MECFTMLKIYLYVNFYIYSWLNSDFCVQIVHGMRYFYLVLNGGWIEAKGDLVIVLESVWLRRKNESLEKLEKGAKSRTWRSVGRRPPRYSEPGPRSSEGILARVRGGSVQEWFLGTVFPISLSCPHKDHSPSNGNLELKYTLDHENRGRNQKNLLLTKNMSLCLFIHSRHQEATWSRIPLQTGNATSNIKCC